MCGRVDPAVSIVEPKQNYKFPANDCIKAPARANNVRLMPMRYWRSENNENVYIFVQ